MNSLIKPIANPNDGAFRMFVDKIDDSVFKALASNLVAEQKNAFGKCIKFDFDNLESVTTVIGSLDDAHMLNCIVDYYNLDPSNCDLNMTDYSKAGADFKTFLNRCLMYVANYFAYAGSLNDYQIFIRDINWDLKKDSMSTFMFVNDLRGLEFVLFDLIAFAYILHRLSHYYSELDLDDNLIVYKGVHGVNEEVFYIPAIRNLASEYRSIKDLAFEKPFNS